MKLQHSVLSVALLTAGLALAGTASAQTQQNQTQHQGYAAYNYFGVGVADHDGGDSIVVEGSYEFKSPYFVSGYYRNFDNDAGSSSDALSIKLGRYFWLSSGLTADVGVRAGHVVSALSIATSGALRVTCVNALTNLNFMAVLVGSTTPTLAVIINTNLV